MDEFDNTLKDIRASPMLDKTFGSYATDQKALLDTWTKAYENNAIIRKRAEALKVRRETEKQGDVIKTASPKKVTAKKKKH